MSPDTGTRERLVAAAAELFAEHGFRGASVRDICNRARANPGAVSYHFGGKRQLYRTVLRRAAEAVAAAAAHVSGDPELPLPERAPVVARRLYRRLGGGDPLVRLVLQDLAVGGDVAVETLVPPLRSAYESLRDALGAPDDPRASAEARRVLLRLAAPVVLLAVAWPVLERTLAPYAPDPGALLEELLADPTARD